MDVNVRKSIVLTGVIKWINIKENNAIGKQVENIIYSIDLLYNINNNIVI